MRTFVAAALTIAALTIAALTIPAYAQGMSKGGGGPSPSASHPGEEQRPVVDEKKYKAAVDRIGEPQQQKYDPWQNVREKPPSK
jgi:hypothetical protein